MSWIVITGASSGIGRSLAKLLHQQKSEYSMILIGRNEKALRELSGALDPRHQILIGDLSSFESISTLSQEIERIVSGQGLRALVNNAGVFEMKSFEESDETLWETQFATNFFAPVRLTQAMKPFLFAAPGSSVINVSSTLAQRPLKNVGAYAASKAALDHWSRCLALEWAPKVRVNLVAPGLVDTPIHSFHRNHDEQGRKIAHQMQPMQRLGQPEEIASMIAYLMGPRADWITGATFNVDGGVSLQ